MQVKFKLHARIQPTPSESTRIGTALSGLLFIEVDGVYFPARNWGDYVLPVLGWWIENAMRLNLPDSEVKNIFMDGPYAFRLRRSANSDDVRLTFQDGDLVLPGEYTISYKRYLAAHRGAAKGILNEIMDMGLRKSLDVSTLETRLEHLLRLEAEIKAHGLP